MEQKIKISSIVIAKDEELNIGKCVDSQKDCIDEIIVLIDNRTKDKTTEIVKSKNVFYEFVEWQGYAQTKQYALSKTSNDWVFWIDADESFTPELSHELNEFKNNKPAEIAYSVPRKAYFLGKWIKHCGWYPGRVTRLFNKQYVKFNQNTVHENLIVEGKVSELKSDLDHWTDPTIEHYFKKFNIYTSLAAEELAGQNKSASIFDILLRPLSIFIKMYFVKLGFLDGLHGFILSIFSAGYVFTKYCKLWELRKSI
ncbi:MAG: glycosyltransferase family 2 protein [Ignavibacteriales bacterium]|nr:glycosyltransferase family 2 protein [Ignavibacteriales bacterium]